MNIFKRLFGSEDEQQPSQFESMTERKVDFSFRIYWTKIGREWSLERVQSLQPKVKAIISQDGFEKNLVARVYTVDGLDELAHSGSSLLALAEVLDALEKTLLEQGES